MKKRELAHRTENRNVFELQLTALQLEKEYDDITPTYDAIYDIVSEHDTNVTTELNTMMRILSEKIGLRKGQAVRAKREAAARTVELETCRAQLDTARQDLGATREERDRLLRNIEEMRAEHEMELADAIHRSLEHERALREAQQQHEGYNKELHKLEERNTALTRELELVQKKSSECVVIDVTVEEATLLRKDTEIALLKQALQKARRMLQEKEKDGAAAGSRGFLLPPQPQPQRQQTRDIVVDTNDSIIAQLRTQLNERTLQLQAMRAVSTGKDDEIRALRRRVSQLESAEKRVIDITDDM